MKKHSMNLQDVARIEKLKYMSKRGERLLPEELDYLRIMHDKYPEEYSKIEERIHDQTISEMNPMYKRKFKE